MDGHGKSVSVKFVMMDGDGGSNQGSRSGRRDTENECKPLTAGVYRDIRCHIGVQIGLLGAGGSRQGT